MKDTVKGERTNGTLPSAIDALQAAQLTPCSFREFYEEDVLTRDRD